MRSHIFWYPLNSFSLQYLNYINDFLYFLRAVLIFLFIFLEGCGSYNIKNKFCDKSSAIRESTEFINVESFRPLPECVNGGNANGYLKNAILPKYSITSNLGLRFLEERLEVGTRMVYHTNVKETRNKSLRDAGWFANDNNNPRWQPVFLVDAYMNYKFNDTFAATLSVTNLTDRYYLRY